MRRDTLTMKEALRFQHLHLAQWKMVLTPAVWEHLCCWAMDTNDTTKSPYDIRRGQELTEWVENMAMSLESTLNAS